MKEACVLQISKTTISFSFYKKKISLRNCVLNPDSRREKEKEKAFCLSLFLFAKPLHKINRVVVV